LPHNLPNSFWSLKTILEGSDGIAQVYIDAVFKEMLDAYKDAFTAAAEEALKTAGRV
jgi:hypothetical protein